MPPTRTRQDLSRLNCEHQLDELLNAELSHKCSIEPGAYKKCYDKLSHRRKSATLSHATSTRPPALRLSDLECLKVLGEGANAKALLIRTRRTGHPLDKPGSLFALKCMPRTDARWYDESNRSRGKQIERSLLAKLPWNPFAVGLEDVFTDKENLYMMLELVPCGTLRSLINKRGPFDSMTSAFYYANITVALSFLLRYGIVHRDLKPDNILVGPDGYLVLTDFGSAERLDDPSASWCDIGAPAYLAPELAFTNLDDPNASTAVYFSGVDWWSSGIILYEMSNRKLPFQFGVFKHGIDLETDMKIPWLTGVSIGKNLKDLITELLRTKPNKRLGTDGIKKHAWLSHVRWDYIEGRGYQAPYTPKEPHIEHTWHQLPLQERERLPGLTIVASSSHILYDDCFPQREEQRNARAMNRE